MRTNTLTCICLLILFALIQPVKAQQGQITSEFKALIPDFLADPSVVLFDGVFYMYATTDIDQGLARMGIPVVWKSNDFVNWSFEGNIMPQIDWSKKYEFVNDKGEQKSGYYRYWAPGKPLKYNNRFYLFPTIVTPDEKMGTYVVIADTPNGPFEFTNGKGLYFNEPDQEANQATPLIPDIDGEPYIDDDGQAYIYWRRRFASKMSDDFSRLIGETISLPTRYSGYSEGPVMFKRNNIYYYIYTLSGHANYCNGYMISRTGPLGPFEVPDGNSIFVHSAPENNIWGPGHGNVFHMPGTDDYYFLYLEYGTGGTTRQIFANKITFNPDGTIAQLIPHSQGIGYLAASAEKRKNLALKAKASASSVRESRQIEAKIIPDPNKLTTLQVNTRDGETHTRFVDFEPKNAIDNANGTRWEAAEEDENPHLVLDLGKKQKISECQLYFIFPTFGHQFKLEASANGKNWKTIETHTEKALRSPHVIQNIGKARYLKISINEGPTGLWEMKVY